MKTISKPHRLWLSIKMAGYLLVPAILLFLPADYFDEGQSLCLITFFSGIECYACGLTRASMHFIHFNWQEANAFNPLAFVAVPALSALWLYSAIKDFKQWRGDYWARKEMNAGK